MGITLAIDTSAGTAVALLKDGQIIAEVNNDNHMAHAETIGAAIAEVRAKAPEAEINSVVVGRGPAPFTGLRVGIAAAMMFAQGASAKLSGVVSLDAIALEAIDERVSATTPLLVTTDARRKEVFYALYSGLNAHGVPVRIEGPAVIKPDALQELLQSRNIFPITTERKITARGVAMLAEAHAKDGTLSDDVTALYLRQPDAVEGQFGKKVSG